MALATMENCFIGAIHLEVFEDLARRMNEL